jgi:hypothetical protein
MDEGQWREAAAHLRQVERGQPTSLGVRLLLADVLGLAGGRDGMEEEYRAVIRLADGSPLGEPARQDLRAAAQAIEP